MKTKLLSAVSLLLPLGLLSCNTVIKEQPVPPAGTVVSFTATPAELAAPGEKATLSWTTADATSVSLEQVGTGPVAIDAKAASGSVEVTLSKDALFVLTARGEGGTDSLATSVRVKGTAQGLVFDAVPRSIPAGGSATLVWSAPGAAAVSLKEVGGAAIELGGQKESGSVRVAPSRSTSYELDADGRKLTVAVEVGIAIYSFELAGAAPLPGELANLTWETSGGSTLTLTREGVTAPLLVETDPTKVGSGTFSELVPATTPIDGLLHYRLELELGALKVSRPLTVRVGGSVTIDELKLPIFAKSLGTFQVQWKTIGADRVELWVDGVLVYLAPDLASVTAGNSAVRAPASGSVRVKLVASNQRGAVAELEKTTTVVGITSFESFTATPTTVAAGGDPVTLSWSAPNARWLKIVANGDYTVFTGRGTAVATGSLIVYPNGPTTYVLTADNTLGDSVTGSQAVTVTAPAIVSQSPGGPVVVGSTVSLGVTVGGAGAKLHGIPSAASVRAASTGFVDISTTGTRLEFTATADDSVLSFTAPDFETWLWGKRLAGNVVVSTNGFLVIGPTAVARAAPVAIPAAAIEPHLYAPYWADLRFGPLSAVYWEVRGEAPNLQLVVQWHKLKVKAQATSEVTFEARLHQTGTVDYEYQTLTLTAAPTIGVGVQGPAGNLGLTHLGGVSANSGLTFFEPTASPAPYAVDSAVELNAWVSIGAGYLKVSYTPQLIQPGVLVISEALYSPAPAIAATGEWIEIFNPTSQPFDLAGFALDFGAGSVHPIAAAGGNTVIPAGGVLVLGQSSLSGENDGVAVQYVYGPSFAMDDTAGVIRLTTGAGGGALASLSWAAGQGGTGASVAGDPGPVLLDTDPVGTAPHAVNCGSTAPFGTQVPQQLGTPGALSQCFAYRRSPIPANYENTFLTGTPVLASASAYSGFGAVTLPAPFTYFGTSYTSINLSMVGFASFGTPLTAAYDTVNNTRVQTTAPNGVIALFWDQIVRNTNGEITMQRMTDYTIISWDDFRIYGGSGSSMSFQLKLFDSGVIEIHYGSMIPGTKIPETSGSSATSWIESPSGDSALVVNLNTAGGIQPNSAWRFTP